MKLKQPDLISEVQKRLQSIPNIESSYILEKIQNLAQRGLIIEDSEEKY